MHFHVGENRRLVPLILAGTTQASQEYGQILEKLPCTVNGVPLSDQD